MARAGFPKRFWGAVADCAEQAAWVAGGGSLYIHGTSGDGKSTFACAVGRRLLLSGKAVRYASSKDLVVGWYDAASRHEIALNAPILVLDDVGKESVTKSAASLLWHVIETRYAAMTPTIITSNYSRDELWGLVEEVTDEQTGHAVASRLREKTIVLEFSGEDMRR